MLKAMPNAQLWDHVFALNDEYLGAFLAAPANAAAGGEVISPAARMAALMGTFAWQYIETHGPDALIPHRKEPLTLEIITGMLNLEGGKLGRTALDWARPEMSLPLCH
jgi:hypothetical protein